MPGAGPLLYAFMSVTSHKSTMLTCSRSSAALLLKIIPRSGSSGPFDLFTISMARRLTLPASSYLPCKEDTRAFHRVKRFYRFANVLYLLLYSRSHTINGKAPGLTCSHNSDAQLLRMPARST